MIFDLIRTNFH